MVKFIAGYIWTQIQITIHKIRVLRNIVIIINNTTLERPWHLYRRGLSHDLSKYKWNEAKYFARVIFDLKDSTYGTEEYKKMLEDIQPAVKHHYKKNKHHPEYHKHGIHSMTEIDKLEMIADWQAATKRHSTGNIFKSIEINQTRFGYDNKTKEWLIKIAKILE